MRRYEQIMVVLLVCSLVYVIAFWSYVRTLPAESPSTLYRELPATVEPPTLDFRYVASTLSRKNMVYHVPKCPSAKQIDHAVWFTTEAQARAAGYEPCQRCLAGWIARVK